MIKKLCIVTTIVAVSLQAEPGCLSNKRPAQHNGFDTKAYESVVCNCPCTKRCPQQNRCVLGCGHAKIPQSFIIVSNKDTETTKKYELEKTFKKKAALLHKRLALTRNP